MPDPITSPYNFVPLSKKVLKPSWGVERGVHGHALSHDVPLKDGLCGTLDITLTNHTPLLIASDPNEQGEKTPLKQGDRYLVPGSSVRGMVRSVVEIATYGKLGPGLEERQLFARDLTRGGQWYRDRMVSAENALETKSKPGWMKLSKDAANGLRYEVHPTAMERMPKAEAIELMGNDKPGTEVIYEGPEGADYVVVQTGPVPRKEREFGFRSEPVGDPLPVMSEVFESFVAAHENNRAWWEQDGKATTPGALQKELRAGKRIPVFYTLDKTGNLNAIGLAYMFRVPYKTSLASAASNTSKDHLDTANFDFAQALFGALPGDKPDDGLRARVSFSALFSDRGALQRNADRLILNSPKPSFYPAYLKQDGKDTKNLESERPELAGWKRYQIRTSPEVYQTGDGQNVAVQSKLRPLDAGAKFSGHIRFHNLRPAELGALVWALTWGGDDRLRHSLGMGKPYGYGSVAVQITGAHITHNSDLSKDIDVGADPSASRAQLAFAVDELTKLMRENVPQWPQTGELDELRALANPVAGDAAAKAGSLRYPSLNAKARINDFRDIKNEDRRLRKASSWLPKG